MWEFPCLERYTDFFQKWFKDLYRRVIYLEGTYLFQLVPGLNSVIWVSSTSCLATEENWNSGCEGASPHICSPFAKLWRWPVWHQGCRASHNRVSAWPMGAPGLLGKADMQMNAYGIVRWAAVGTAPLCCRSTEEEGIWAREVLLADSILPKLASRRLAMDGANLVHFMGKQRLFRNTWLSWIFVMSYGILGGIKSGESASGMTSVSLWPVAYSEYH